MIPECRQGKKKVEVSPELKRNFIGTSALQAKGESIKKELQGLFKLVFKSISTVPSKQIW